MGELRGHTACSDEVPDPQQRGQVRAYLSLAAKAARSQPSPLVCSWAFIHQNSSQNTKTTALDASVFFRGYVRLQLSLHKSCPWNPWVILVLLRFCVFIFLSVWIAWNFQFAKGFNQQQMFWIRLKPKYFKSHVFILSCWVQSFSLASEGQRKALATLMNCWQQTGMLVVNSDECLP